MTWYCAVSVATVWTSPESVREIDREAAMNPVRLKKWLEHLSYGPRLDLCESNLTKRLVAMRLKFAMWSRGKKETYYFLPIMKDLV